MKNTTIELVETKLQAFNLSNFRDRILEVVDAVKGFAPYNKILVSGNGGSASDSMHISGELMKDLKLKRSIDPAFKDAYLKLYGEDDVISHTEGAIRTISLVGETSLITAISNDIGYPYVFSQQLYGLGDKGDILLAFSTSGNSKSIINAAKVAKAKGIKVVSFTGKTGGELRLYSDILFNTDLTDTCDVQQIHEILYHILCMALENEAFN